MEMVGSSHTKCIGVDIKSINIALGARCRGAELAQKNIAIFERRRWRRSNPFTRTERFFSVLRRTVKRIECVFLPPKWKEAGKNSFEAHSLTIAQLSGNCMECLSFWTHPSNAFCIDFSNVSCYTDLTL